VFDELVARLRLAELLPEEPAIAQTRVVEELARKNGQPLYEGRALVSRAGLMQTTHRADAAQALQKAEECFTALQAPRWLERLGEVRRKAAGIR
jgi:hypothetical protein